MPPVSVIPIVLIGIPLALGSPHSVGTSERYCSFIIHENVLPRLIKLGMDMIKRDVLVLFPLLSPIYLGIIIFPLGVVLSFLTRA